MPMPCCAITWPIMFGVGLVLMVLGIVLMVVLSKSMFMMLVGVGGLIMFAGIGMACTMCSYARLG